MRPHRNVHNTEKIRSISTNDIDELAQFQIDKNRQYTQLQAGHLRGRYLEINLNTVQIFRETLTTGALIAGAPASTIAPFAAVLSHGGDFHFCGKQRQKNTILQATGGSWDASFEKHVSFIVAAFNKESFSDNIQQLTGREVASEWLVSKACLTDPLALRRYADGLNAIMNIVQKKPEILASENAVRMLGDSAFTLVFDVIGATTPHNDKPPSRSNRRLGVRRVIDYLHSYAVELPTISELCKIANLSGRNLQYAFKEYLGVTPIGYLRLLRLNGVRRDLLISNSKDTRITDVALDWGFIELGRFAGEYYRLFQELPSVTIKRQH
jgi:AraC family ethanolamine operon transcriptional activator